MDFKSFFFNELANTVSEFNKDVTGTASLKDMKQENNRLKEENYLLKNVVVYMSEGNIDKIEAATRHIESIFKKHTTIEDISKSQQLEDWNDYKKQVYDRTMNTYDVYKYKI